MINTIELIPKFLEWSSCTTEHDIFYNPKDAPPATTDNYQYHYNQLYLFQTSWEKLMLLVEKICQHVYDEQEENTGFEKRIIKNRANLRTFGMINEEGKYMVRFNRSPLFEADTLIEATYNATMDWLKWYYNQ